MGYDLPEFDFYRDRSNILWDAVTLIAAIDFPKTALCIGDRHEKPKKNSNPA
jgi:hypothetical protein